MSSLKAALVLIVFSDDTKMLDQRYLMLLSNLKGIIEADDDENTKLSVVTNAKNIYKQSCCCFKKMKFKVNYDA